MTKDTILFPGLHITLKNVGQGFDIFGFHIAFYGVVIAFGMLMATLLIMKNARRYGESPDHFYDITFTGIVLGVIGARVYYCAFEWDSYKDNLLSIFNLRGGGLAIYGGIIGGALGVYIMSRIRKIPFLKAADIVIPGVVVGQICGRWGNFFNREAFGGYSGGIFRMGLPIDGIYSQSYLTEAMLKNAENIDGVEFVFVHPTFLYESLWNVGVLILLIALSKKISKQGAVFGVYLIAYGIGRFFIESLRTDQLTIGNTGIPVSMCVSVICVVLGSYLIFIRKP